MIKLFLILLIIIESLSLNTSINAEQSPWEQVSEVKFQENDFHRIITEAVMAYTIGNHQDRIHINDAFMQKTLDIFIRNLDPDRIYFWQSDVDTIKSLSQQLLEDLIGNATTNRPINLKIPFAIFNTFLGKFRQVVAVKRSLTNYPFNFALDEYRFIKRTTAPRPTNFPNIKELARLNIKSHLIDYRLKTTLNNQSQEQLIHRLLNENHRKFKAITRYGGLIVMDLFLDAFLYNFDPHSSYINPEDQLDLMTKLTNNLEGVGIYIKQDNNNNIIIERVIKNSPAGRSNSIFAGDSILAVGENKIQLTSVKGLGIKQVKKLLRGPKGSKVFIKILSKNKTDTNSAKVVTIVRDQIIDINTTVTLEVIENVGVIKIPSFYSNVGPTKKPDQPILSVSDDVRLKLQQAKDSNLEGVILDLRDNAGGQLTEAVALSTLFVSQSPVVQVKMDKEIESLPRQQNQVAFYKNPLVVLVNKNSASASEVFAALIQDKKRGVVVGDEHTFGKGSVQSIFLIDKLFPVALIKYPPLNMYQGRLGILKITKASYYRLTGKSLQGSGVFADIVIPSRNFAEHGAHLKEKSQSNIKATDFSLFDPNLPNKIETLKVKSQTRITNNFEFQWIRSDRQKWLQRKQSNRISLNLQTRQQTASNEEKLSNDRNLHRTTVYGKDFKQPDFILSESVNILRDYINI